jgi:predicted glycogen debranching enzyme
MSPTSDSAVAELPPPLTVACSDAELEGLLTQEWLLSNGIGAYASSTVVGCNTRRYHGLLVATLSPPVQRVVALSTVMEQLTVDGVTYDLATNEFAGSFSPRGVVHLSAFRNDVAATFVYRVGDVELTKEIILADGRNAVALRYRLTGGSARLRLRPFAALRDFHHLRLA